MSCPSWFVEVGGDLYDFHRQGDDLWFIIGDVSGKGVAAALFMSAAVNLFRAAIGHQTSPKSIMEEMNAVLSENLTVVNAPALTDKINLHKDQDIEKVVFDATNLTYISSSGIRVILYCKKYLSKSPEIVFVNCNKDILDVFDLVGIIPFITFVTTP